MGIHATRVLFLTISSLSHSQGNRSNLLPSEGVFNTPRWPPVSLASGQASELESRAVGGPLTNAFWVQHKRLRSPHQLTF